MDPLSGMEVFTVLVLGLIYGSFATALIHRIPSGIAWSVSGKGASRTMPRSACPSCGTQLKWYDLLPLLSWIMVRGRCRYCRRPIGWTYPAVEIATMAGCFGIYLNWGFGPVALAVMFAVPLLVALIVIDFRHFILPDTLNGMLAILWIVVFLAGWNDQSWAHALMGSVLGAMIYGLLAYALGMVMRKILKKDALGLGDVKFFAVAGLWLGLDNLSLFLTLSGVFGVVMGIVYIKMTKNPYFPFGPALVAAFYILLTLYGPYRPYILNVPFS